MKSTSINTTQTIHICSSSDLDPRWICFSPEARVVHILYNLNPGVGRDAKELPSHQGPYGLTETPFVRWNFGNNKISIRNMLQKGGKNKNLMVMIQYDKEHQSACTTLDAGCKYASLKQNLHYAKSLLALADINRRHWLDMIVREIRHCSRLPAA